jgi:hypothetical protein
MQLLHFSWERHRFLRFGASWSPMAAWSPRCLPDASQMPPRCLPDASQMPLRCFFSKWFLLYDSLFNDSSSRISSLSSLLQRVPLHDSSWLISLPWFFEWVYKETLFGVSRWGHFFVTSSFCCHPSVLQSLFSHYSVVIQSLSSRHSVAIHSLFNRYSVVTQSLFIKYVPQWASMIQYRITVGFQNKTKSYIQGLLLIPHPRNAQPRCPNPRWVGGARRGDVAGLVIGR